MTTDTIDRLFLELSQFTTAFTAREIALGARVAAAREILISAKRAAETAFSPSAFIEAVAKALAKLAP